MMAGLSDTAERRIARLASRSHGVVTRAELVAAGISEDQIDHRLLLGALIRAYCGVYLVGHKAHGVEAGYLAAVRACGPRAVLSGRAAAHLWGLIKGFAPAPEVTAPGRRRAPGVRTRRSRQGETTTFRGIPVTTVPRTLVDIAGEMPEE